MLFLKGGGGGVDLEGLWRVSITHQQGRWVMVDSGPGSNSASVQKD